MNGFADRPQGHEVLSACPWRGDMRWVYSITFDEALSALSQFAIPILEEYGVPGHVEVVVGQMGQVRSVGSSSYNGFKHMDADELKELLSRGWGVGNHSWSHTGVDRRTAEIELRRSKETLEDAIGAPVTVYCSPGTNANMNAEALTACRQLGYTGAMSITDALNRTDASDLLWLNRTFLHDQAPPPFHSEFDPFRQIQHAKREQGWVIDYLHCPLETAVHPQKDCSASQLRDRIQTVVDECGADVWLARVEEAIDYRYTRRALNIDHLAGGEYELSAPGLPDAVASRELTLRLPDDTVAVAIDGAQTAPYKRSGRILVDVELSRPRRVRVTRRESRQIA